MKQTVFRLTVWVALASLLGHWPIHSAAVTEQQVRSTVTGWLRADSAPLGTIMGQQVDRIVTHTEENGNPLYYVVYVKPAGFVIVSANDWIEPIIAFAAQGQYDPSTNNPLGALVNNDLPARLAKTAATNEATTTSVVAKRKWDRLIAVANAPSEMEYGLGSVSDERVAPLVQSRWNQETVSGSACYNYYTPPNASGSANNYPCGCVATAMAQLMRFHQHPANEVGTVAFTISVDGVSESRDLRGGDGAGGPYAWANMPLVPSNPGTAQRQAIGALTADAGVSVNMSYAQDGSGTDTLKAKDALLNTFGYANAIKGWNSGDSLGSDLNGMVNPNLDAGYPVLFGITGTPGGHAIVCDGYGYNSSTLYHHLNLGWSGTDDAWYALPTIDATGATFTSVYKCVYNVYVSGSGEIISGRVSDSAGSPLSGASVTANRTGGGTYVTTTNPKGIYALAKIPSASSYTINVSKPGYSFVSRTVTTGTSIDDGANSGNRWGTDFGDLGSTYRLTILSSGISPVVIELSEPAIGEITGVFTPSSVDYFKGERVVLTARNRTDTYLFTNWSGAIESQNGVYAEVLMDRDRTVTANYESIPVQPGTDFTVDGYDWDDSKGDGDCVIEGGERVSLRVRLRSAANVSSISATLSSSLGNLTITDDDVTYPDISSGGTAWPGDEFDMRLDLAATTDVPSVLRLNYFKAGVEYRQTLSLDSKRFYQQGVRNAAFAIVPPMEIDDSTALRAYNNGDGVIQSGEVVRLRPKLRNSGQACATGILGWLGYDGTAFTVDPNDKEDYPDLGAGQEEYLEGAGNFRIEAIRRDFTGCEYVDFILTYDQNPAEPALPIVLPGAVEICVQPASWLQLAEETFDFGIVSPGTLVTHTTLVQNVGSAILQITDITTDTNTTWIGTSLPWTLPPGQSTNLVVQINTTGLQGQISRQVQVFSTGRVRKPGEDDRLTISGLVSDTVPVYQIPNATGWSPDISGDWVVWNSSLSTNRGIWAFNIATGQQRPICTNSAGQSDTRICSNIVVWEDNRNGSVNYGHDIYAYDLSRPDLGEFPVLLSSGHADLIGVDGNLVAIVVDYHTFTEDSNWDSARNLVVFQYQGSGSFTQRFHSGFASNASHSPMESFDNGGDFRNGLLVSERHQLYWYVGSSHSYWSDRSQRYQVINFGAGGNSLRDAVNSWGLYPSAELNRFVYRDRDADGDQIYMWHKPGTLGPITSGEGDYADDALAIGGPDGTDCILYDLNDASRPGLHYLDRSNGLKYLISSSVDPADARMDGLRVVFKERISDLIKYVFLKQPDVQVTAPGITFSHQNPVEGTPIDVSVLVRNLSAYDQSGNITVNLCDGDPDSGATNMLATQVFSGLAAHTDRTVVFSNVTSLAEGERDIYVKLAVTTSDAPNNNKASRQLTVMDNDTEPPVVSLLEVSEIGGDGDGVIGTDEYAQLSFAVDDEGGVASIQVLLDGAAKAVSGSLTNPTVALGKLSQGAHNLEIRATDGDLSPSSGTNSFPLDVVEAEKMVVLFGNAVVTNGQSQPVNLGTHRLGSSTNLLFIIENEGQQALSVSPASITGAFSVIGPASANVLPSGGTSFTIRPSTTTIGSYTGIVTITNSDLLTANRFVFAVAATIIPAVIQDPPRFLGIKVIGQFVQLNFSAPANNICRLEWSPDLANWTLLKQVFAGSNGLGEEITTVSTTEGQRFYRITLSSSP